MPKRHYLPDYQPSPAFTESAQCLELGRPCERCGGCVVIEQDDTHHTWRGRYRCINCGHRWV